MSAEHIATVMVSDDQLQSAVLEDVTSFVSSHTPVTLDEAKVESFAALSPDLVHAYNNGTITDVSSGLQQALMV